MTYVRAQLCPNLGGPMENNLPGSSVHGIFQSRRLEQIAISFSRDLTDPGIKPTSPASSALAGGFLFCFFFRLSHWGSPMTAALMALIFRVKVIFRARGFRNEYFKVKK